MSDNTGNTKLCRKMVVTRFPWIIDLPDPVHRLQLNQKDIGSLEYFKPVRHAYTLTAHADLIKSDN